MVGVVIGVGFWRNAISGSVGNADLNLWLSASVQLVNAVLGPPLAAIGDSCGRRNQGLISIICGVVGGCLISSAKSMGQAIAGSVIFGIYYANSSNFGAICSEVVPKRHRSNAQFLFNAIGTLGIPLAAIAGGQLVATNPGGYEGWRSLMWLLTALCAVAFFPIFFLYNPPPVPNPLNRSLTVRLLDFDIVGTLLFAGGLVPILMALVWGGAKYTWSSPHCIASLVVGCVVLVLLGVHQSWIKKDGLLHHDLFRNRNFFICLFALFAEGVVYLSFAGFYGEETAILFDSRPLYFGLRYNLFTAGTYGGFLFFPYIVYKWKLVKECMVTGFVLFIAGIAGLATVKGPQDGMRVLGYCFVAGMGWSAPLALVSTVVQLSVGPEFIGRATALAIMARSVGGSVGASIAAAVFTAKITTALPAYIAKVGIELGLPTTSLPEFVGGLATGNLTLAEMAPGVTPQMLQAGGVAAASAYAFAFKYVWIVQIPFLTVALILACCLKSVKADMNATIDRPLDHKDTLGQHHLPHLPHIHKTEA